MDKREQIQYIQKYKDAHYDRIAIAVPKGKRDIYKLHASRVGKSLAGLIIDLLEQDINRVDNELGEDLARKSLKVADDLPESR